MHKYIATGYRFDKDDVDASEILTLEIFARSLRQAYERAYAWTGKELELAHVIEVTPDDEIPVEFDF